VKKHFLFLTGLIIGGLFFLLSPAPAPTVIKTLEQDNPNRAALLDFEKMKDPALQRIPFERYDVAMSRSKQLLRSDNQTTNLQWHAIPSNMGGRTKTVCFDPNDPTREKVWAGAATGGLWYNNHISDTNSTWVPVSDVWESLSVSSICFNPINPQEMYVGTGEYETAITDMYRESSGRGFGIWKSTDGGQSFQRLLSTRNFAYISDLVIKNENGTAVIYAGVVSGIYRGAQFNAQPSEGLYRSYDGGLTWEQVLPLVNGTGYVYAPADIEIAANGNIIVGTKRNVNNEGGGTILLSASGNRGSWTIVDTYKTEIENSNDYNIPGRVKIASAPSNPQKIYALLTAQSQLFQIEGFPQTIGKFLIVSNDGGQTWQHQNIPESYSSGKNWAYLAWHALSLAVNPNNENILFAGGLDVNVSTNGGNTWNRISDWSAMYQGGGDNYVHADIHRIVFDKNNTNRMIIATDGGVFYTETAQLLQPVFYNRNKSYNTLQFYSTNISKQGTEFLVGGLQDNGTLFYSGQALNENDMIQGGDGAFCRFDSDEDIVITSTYDNQFKVFNYGNGQFNWIYDYASGLFTSTFDYDSNDNIIWAIASDLHDNRLNEVLKITDLLNTANGTFINLNTQTDKYFSAIRLLNSDQLLIGTANGKLYKVSNINTTPTAVQIDNGVFPNGFISCIQTLNNGQGILVVISNYGVPSVWQSLNGGATWRNVEGNLPDIPVRWAIYHPQNPDRVMLATETGIWLTDNINAQTVTWVPQNNGLPLVRIDMVDVRPDNNKVVAGTHGRGLFTTTWNDVQTVNETSYQPKFVVYPNPAHRVVNIRMSNVYKKIEILDLNGKVLKQYQVKQKNMQLNIDQLTKGYYLIKAENTVQKLLVQ